MSKQEPRPQFRVVDGAGGMRPVSDLRMGRPSFVVAGVGAGVVFTLSLLASRVVPSVGPAVAAALLAGILLLFLHHWNRAQFEQGQRLFAEALELRAQLQLQEPAFEHPLPWSGWALPARALLDVVGTVLIRGGRTVVECGSGVSTLYLARLLKATGAGHVYSLEHDEKWAALVDSMLDRNALADWATVIRAPLRSQTILGHETSWYEIPDGALPQDPVDVLLVDGPVGLRAPLARLGALPFFHERLAADAVVFLDDAVREDEQQIKEIWCREYDMEATYVDTTHGLLKFERAGN